MVIDLPLTTIEHTLLLKTYERFFLGVMTLILKYEIIGMRRVDLLQRENIRVDYWD